MAWNGGAGPDAVERGVRRARAAARRAGVAPALRGWSPACWPASRSRSAPTSIIAVGLVLGWLLWRAPRRPAARSLVGAAVGLLPMWVHLVDGRTGQGVPRAWSLDPVFHLRAGRELPRPPSWSRLDGALQAVAEEIPPWWRLPHLSASQGAVPVVLRHGARHRRLWSRSPSGSAAGRAPRQRPLDRAARRGADQRRHPAAGAAAAGLGPPQLGHVRVVARSRSSPASRSCAGGGRGSIAGPRWRSAPPSPSP